MISEPIINVDWLQLFCDLSQFSIHTSLRYEVKEGAKSRTFSEIGTVFFQAQPVMEISRKPFSTIMNQSCGLVKFDNSLLYQQNAIATLEWLLWACNIRPLSITRIDVAGDFERIAGKEPNSHIYDILTGNVLKVGKSRMYVRGEDVWRLNGVRQIGQRTWVAFNSFDAVATGAGRYVYMRYGSANSDVLAYLYNKTRELKEVKDKPYIRERWQRAGAVNDVWRLEFSIKGRRFDFVNKETGDILPNDWRVYMSSNIVSIFEMLCKHYWDIRLSTGQIRKDREPPVELWQGFEGDVLVLNSLENRRPSNVRERRLIKQLNMELQNARYEGNVRLCTEIVNLAQTFIKRYNLEDWDIKQCFNWNVTTEGEQTVLPTS